MSLLRISLFCFLGGLFIFSFQNCGNIQSLSVEGTSELGIFSKASIVEYPCQPGREGQTHPSNRNLKCKKHNTKGAINHPFSGWYASVDPSKIKEFLRNSKPSTSLYL